MGADFQPRQRQHMPESEPPAEVSPSLTPLQLRPHVTPQPEVEPAGARSTPVIHASDVLPSLAHYWAGDETAPPAAGGGRYARGLWQHHQGTSPAERTPSALNGTAPAHPHRAAETPRPSTTPEPHAAPLTVDNAPGFRTPAVPAHGGDPAIPAGKCRPVDHNPNGTISYRRHGLGEWLGAREPVAAGAELCRPEPAPHAAQPAPSHNTADFSLGGLFPIPYIPRVNTPPPPPPGGNLEQSREGEQERQRQNRPYEAASGQRRNPVGDGVDRDVHPPSVGSGWLAAQVNKGVAQARAAVTNRPATPRASWRDTENARRAFEGSEPLPPARPMLDPPQQAQETGRRVDDAIRGMHRR
jgi:hypothetical protein